MTTFLRKIWRVAPLVAVLGLAGPAAYADGSTPNTVYVGVAYMQNHSSLPDLSGYNTPPGLNLNVGNAATLGLTYVRDLPGPWSFELALGYPPRVRTDAMGANWAKLGIQPGTGITDVDVVSPTAFINYHFWGHDAKWDPFVGLGINYTRFTNTKALSSLTSHLGPTDISLSDSWGAAAHAGLIYHIDKRWAVVGTIAVADVQSDLTTTSYSPSNPSLITSQSKTHINFHPIVYTLAVGYSF
ncbi:outer membrane protein W precursor [mine drainage metagenome]|uniref:Outer membrane protein W n=1 Tax=mine drainage metagenome TaxID=410659 RepID=A0A1J5R9S2_9ZZZZ